MEDWLRSIGLEAYAPAFAEHGYDNLLVCSHLSEEDLDLLGVVSAGHRKTLLLYSKQLQQQRQQRSNSIDASSEATGGGSSSSSSGFPSHRPILTRAEDRSLPWTYWQRAQPRKEPFDQDVPNLMRKELPHLHILLVRHGESMANVDQTLHTKMGDHAIPLSQKGKQQAAEAGKQIAKHFKELYKADTPPPLPCLRSSSNTCTHKAHYCRLWTSPYLRARQTAEIIAENAEGWVTDIRENIFLVEQQFGLFEGYDWYSGELDHAFPRELHYYQKAAAFGGRFWAKIPLGESRFDVCQRVYSSFGTFQRDAKRHGITNLVIVAHGITLRAFLMMWLHLSPEWFEEEPNPSNCSIRVIGFDFLFSSNYGEQELTLVETKTNNGQIMEQIKVIYGRLKRVQHVIISWMIHTPLNRTCCFGKKAR
ncbi:Histidine phosphatase family protein [Balamuthia mandrillaris]